MPEFSVGDTVRIREDSEYYGQCSVLNPDDQEGRISSTTETGSHLIWVEWEEDGNCYRPEDLELVVVKQKAKKRICFSTWMQKLEGKEIEVVAKVKYYPLPRTKLARWTTLLENFRSTRRIPEPQDLMQGFVWRYDETLDHDQWSAVYEGSPLTSIQEEILESWCQQEGI